jgi:hypothetical protein
MNDTSIPIRVAMLIIMGQDHDITSGGWIDSILLTLEIVACIVDAKRTMKVNSVVLDVNAAMVCIREVVFIAVVTDPH